MWKEINATEMTYFACFLALLPKHIGNIIPIPFLWFFISWSQHFTKKKDITNTQKSKEWGNYFFNQEVSNRARVRTKVTGSSSLTAHLTPTLHLSLTISVCLYMYPKHFCMWQQSVFCKGHAHVLYVNLKVLFVSILCIGVESHWALFCTHTVQDFKWK